MSQSLITFCGGADEVTGANFLLNTGRKKILVDCGLTHGKTYCAECDQEFSYNPADIDLLFVTHAHADHIGKIPKLVRDGFTGTIWSTQATKDLTRVMLQDAHKILVEEAREAGVPPLYDVADINQAMMQWKTREYHDEWEIGDGVHVQFLDAGHILGSAMVQFTRAMRKIVFTGDLGNSPAPLLPDTEKIHDAHYLVMESVYGDRNHEHREDRIKELARAIRNTANQHGTLLIPSFALQRTQILIHEIHKLFVSGQAPEMPVYLDSPLAQKVTDIFARHRDLFNRQIQHELAQQGGAIFDYPHFVDVRNTRESYEIDKKDGPKIILASSGMSVGGRIRSHEKSLLEDKHTIFLFVGYQAYGTLGRKIQDGARKLEIDGKHVRVRADVRTIRGFSGHKDRNHLVEFVSHTAKSLEHAFVVMGEPSSSQSLAQKIHEDLGVTTSTHKKDDVEEILF